MDKEEGLLGSRAQPGWLGPSTGQACSSLSLCALSTLCHQGPEQVPGVLDSRSRTERVAPHTSLASSAKWMPSSAERAPGTPAAPSPRPRSGSGWICGHPEMQPQRPHPHRRGTQMLECQLLWQNRASARGAGRGSTRTPSSPSLSFKGDKIQTKRKKKKIKTSLSKRRRRSQNGSRQSRLRNLHFKMPSDPLSYIPREDCNTAALGQPFGQAQASRVGHGPGRGLPGWMLGRHVRGWWGGAGLLLFPRLCSLSSRL